jgi:2-polyprenyl-3-methyl-5-hydroxy-6-metoxy-1,4-benzoquinol methylase
MDPVALPRHVGAAPRDADAGAARSCPVCAGDCQTEAQLADDRYGYPGRYPMLVCGRCGHRHLGLQMTSEQIGALYTNYYPRSDLDVEAWQPPREHSALYAWWRGLRSSAFRWVPRRVKVLDIGCGFGESLGYHRQRDCEAEGVEADSNAARVAARHGLTIRIGLFDASQYAPQSFDVVTLDQVIEHVRDPDDLLQGVHRVLKPGGTVVLSTPNAAGWGARSFGRKWIHWHSPYHLQFFSRRSLLQLAQRSGFTVEQVATVTHSSWLAFQWLHLASYPADGERSVFWNQKLPRSALQRAVFAALAVIDRLGVNALLTRLMDALGQGDNMVFVLRKTANA